MCGGERLDCSYQCTLGDDCADLTRDELATRFLDRLEELRPDELRRQQTLVGPHRDDLAFSIDGRDARTFGSQGQQRSIVLAWKMAEVELAYEILGEQPLLLLDDVMSELDHDQPGLLPRRAPPRLRGGELRWMSGRPSSATPPPRVWVPSCAS